MSPILRFPDIPPALEPRLGRRKVTEVKLEQVLSFGDVLGL